MAKEVFKAPAPGVLALILATPLRGSRPERWLAMSEKQFANTELREASTILQFSVNKLAEPGAVEVGFYDDENFASYLLVCIRNGRRLKDPMKLSGVGGGVNFDRMIVATYDDVAKFPEPIRKIASGYAWVEGDQLLLYEVKIGKIPKSEAPEVTFAFWFTYQ